MGAITLLACFLSAANSEPGPASADRPRVVLVSLDGAADWLVDDLLARGVLPPDGALARLARRGVRAEALLPPAASLTAPSHLTLFTGAYPERHGIVSNTFLEPGDPISRPSSGFSAPVYVETMWEAARRQGKRVYCVAAVGADASAPGRRCDLTLAYGRAVGPAGVVELEAAPAASPPPANGSLEHLRRLKARASSSSPLLYSLYASQTVSLFASAVDTVRDGQERYDALLLDFNDNVADGFAARLTVGQWLAVYLPIPTAKIGGWVKLLQMAPDASTARLYLGAPGQNQGDPADFATKLEERLGPWPGSPDSRNLDLGLIDESTWLEQAERLGRYLTDAALDTLPRGNWDLFLAYLPVIDEVGHRFLLRDPRQPDYDAESGARRARYARHVEWSYQFADRMLLRMMEAALPGTNFVVISDHGMAPVHTQVLINSLLRKAGFHVTADEKTEVRAFTSGNTAHIYLNLAGRQPGGVVAADKLEENVERILRACRELQDPLTGEPVFEVVLRQSELAAVRLGHSGRAGDVWVNARPGFTLSAKIELEPEAFELTPNLLGMHGSLGAGRKMHGIFFAGGAQLQPDFLGRVDSVDVAPTVAALLGIDPPTGAQGHAVLKPVR
ncbi:MAG: alkaline phosphatase family protein [Candidatus Acidiferrales bacterium]